MSDLLAATHAAPPATYGCEKLRLIRGMCAKDFSEWWNAQKEVQA